MEKEVVLDNVCALPIESGKLRLYCLRLSDKILVLGNGGIKRTKTYNEDSELSGYVVTLQKFDEILRMELKKGTITIEQTEILGYEEKNISYEHQRTIQQKRSRNFRRGKEGDGTFVCNF